MTIHPTDPSPGISLSIGEALSPQQQTAEHWLFAILAVVAVLILADAFWPEISAWLKALGEPDDDFGGEI